MALRLFHKILIGSGVLFCLGFGSAQVARYARERQSADLATGAVSVAAGVALALYLRRYAGRPPQT